MMNKQNPKYWCHTCKIDLQSSKSLEEHNTGRRHANLSIGQAKPPKKERMPPPIDEADLFELISRGHFQNVVILTGAGVSTAAGIPDFRSPGGLFETLRTKFGKKYPFVYDSPETLLSRNFVTAHPDVYQYEILPLLEDLGKSFRSGSSSIQPTLTHRFCAWLNEKGWLRRVYTQNVDGLHLHPTLNIEKEKVVECHGSMIDGNPVLYGDDLPQRFYDCCDLDFDQIIPKNASDSSAGTVDLILVFGTSLQVFPFCAVPNLVPRGCTRVIVNRCLEHCLIEKEETPAYRRQMPRRVRIGKRRSVSMQNLWTGREGNTRWRQLLIESDCDDFVQRFNSVVNDESHEEERSE
mmetsp:Transcript_1352/g.1841  ORF Transcript_1352/g.1841 Transcript_1352/m.1841 type:complete len:350 (+) Transcript_1352:219-1268(+)|eukprot:CAMPEP_0194082294 /NCGR_PEP_ID=MMETSP0149-20130528/7840_1 /TAXON_ID=122233 /ORGANISM="Chaetoceros debilis, Strain MM31A-1" /LENGTH=349 /DNA_ID=CAMNT_0038764411 /DNA_START=141 /DNA_END=1190 /DNA_ORIENTATION=+